MSGGGGSGSSVLNGGYELSNAGCFVHVADV
jgi:hypothetical protein